MYHQLSHLKAVENISIMNIVQLKHFLCYIHFLTIKTNGNKKLNFAVWFFFVCLLLFIKNYNNTVTPSLHKSQPSLYACDVGVYIYFTVCSNIKFYVQMEHSCSVAKYIHAFFWIANPETSYQHPFQLHISYSQLNTGSAVFNLLN